MFEELLRSEVLRESENSSYVAPYDSLKKKENRPLAHTISRRPGMEKTSKGIVRRIASIMCDRPRKGPHPK